MNSKLIAFSLIALASTASAVPLQVATASSNLEQSQTVASAASASSTAAAFEDNGDYQAEYGVTSDDDTTEDGDDTTEDGDDTAEDGDDTAEDSDDTAEDSDDTAEDASSTASTSAISSASASGTASTASASISASSNRKYNTTLLSISNDHLEQVISILKQNNLKVAALSDTSSSGSGVDGVQDKSFGSVMLSIFKTGMNILGVFI